MKTSIPFRNINEEEVTIRLNSYDDIFSDFDNRSYHNRMLSSDFLDEMQKIVQELPKKSKIIVSFKIKEKQRNNYTESIIVNNILHHYKQYNEEIYEELRETNKKGYLFTIVGFLIISIPVLLSVLMHIDSFSNHFYLMVEPFGWFLAFTGMDKLFQGSRTSKRNINFNYKMLQAKFNFCSNVFSTEANLAGTEQLPSKSEASRNLEVFSITDYPKQNFLNSFL